MAKPRRAYEAAAQRDGTRAARRTRRREFEPRRKRFANDGVLNSHDGALKSPSLVSKSPSLGYQSPRRSPTTAFYRWLRYRLKTKNVSAKVAAAWQGAAVRMTS